MSVVLLIVLTLPALAGLICRPAGRRLGDRAGRLGALGTGLAFALTIVLAVVVVGSGPISAVISGSGRYAGLGVFADRLSVVMLLLVLGVSAVVQLYSSRYLSGDPRGSRLILAAGLTTTAVAVVVSAATVSVLVLAWVASGGGLLLLLAQRHDLPAARLGMRRTALAFAIGDLALLAVAVLVWTTVGDLDLRHLAAGAARLGERHVDVLGVSLSAGAMVACLLVVAAMGRSAQVPLGRWLPATLAAPTPVSALLHAGLVNAGGFLLVRFGPLFGLSPVATYLAFAVGAFTALYGTALMLAKPDVKGALAHSTMGQMGFMIMACALGAFAAAIFHLVAHGMYKATLFLGADSVIHNQKRQAIVARPVPAGVGWPAPARLLLCTLVPAAALALALSTFASAALAHRGAAVLIAFAWTTAAHAAWAWLGSTPGRALTGLAALVVSCAGYAALLAGANAFLDPALSSPRHPATAWLALVPAGVAVVALLLRSGPVSGWRRALYARALDSGHVTGSRTRRRASRRPEVPRYVEASRSVTA